MSVVAVCSANVWWGDLLVAICGVGGYALTALPVWEGRCRACEGSIRSPLFPWHWRSREAHSAGAAWSRVVRFVAASILQVVVVALILIGSIEMPAVYAALTREPIGEVSDYGGDPTLDCTKIDLAPISNFHGEVAAVRRLRCLISFPEDGTDRYFVFVHKSTETNKKQNLVFRYNDGDDKGPPPRLRWSAQRTLNIVVDRPIFQITFRRRDREGYAIRYKTGVAACVDTSRWLQLKSALLWSGC
jgi:hypothetical protein